MTNEEIFELGWKEMHPGSKGDNMKSFIYEAEGFDYHIMSVGFGMGEDISFDVIMINCVPKDNHCNIWENSETHFYGNLKQKEELDLVMQFIGVTKYKQ